MICFHYLYFTISQDYRLVKTHGLLFQTTKVGDTLICIVSNRQAVIGVKILIVEGDKPHVVADLGIKAVLPLASINSNQPLLSGEFLRATVLEIVPEADKLVIGQATLYTEPMPAIYKLVKFLICCFLSICMTIFNDSYQFLGLPI